MANRPSCSVILSSLLRFSVSLVVIGMVAACAPHDNWREVRGTDEPYVVLLPDKPSSSTRSVKLGNAEVSMRMTTAQLDGTTFAVGSATLAEASAAPAALSAMKSALVNNIGGTILSEASSAAASSGGAAGSQTTSLAVEASGSLRAGREVQAAYLKARFVSRGRRIYQVVILSRGKPIAPDLADTFFTSFKPD